MIDSTTLFFQASEKFDDDLDSLAEYIANELKEAGKRAERTRIYNDLDQVKGLDKYRVFFNRVLSMDNEEAKRAKEVCRLTVNMDQVLAIVKESEQLVKYQTGSEYKRKHNERRLTDAVRRVSSLKKLFSSPKTKKGKKEPSLWE
jgi:hypothetical protein